MAVKIRLMRIGTNRRPFYRVVAVDERRKRTGGYIELLGTYNPLTEPKEINLDQGKIDAWIKKGAVPSYGFLRIIGKAPQRAPRKAKKEKKEKSVTSPQPSAQEQKPGETAAESVEQADTQAPVVESPVSESLAQESKTEENIPAEESKEEAVIDEKNEEVKAEEIKTEETEKVTAER